LPSNTPIILTAILADSTLDVTPLLSDLLAAGADIDAIGFSIPVSVPGGGTALMGACYMGYVERARWLLGHGADAFALNRCGVDISVFVSMGGTRRADGNEGVRLLVDEWIGMDSEERRMQWKEEREKRMEKSGMAVQKQGDTEGAGKVITENNRDSDGEEDLISFD
jgi:hypothetical protein